MSSCKFLLNRMLHSTLQTTGGWYTAFSGLGPHRNDPDACRLEDKGPIPLGTYHIVDRHSGGLLSSLRDWASGRDEWFALYRNDGVIDDQTFVQGVRRGLFRLHPGAGSKGCVTLPHATEFDSLRAWLRDSPPAYVGPTMMRTYGTLDVVALAPAMLEPKFGPKNVGHA
jgi:hypothetical protein